MAESIIVHFRSADRSAVAAALGELASRVPQDEETWYYPHETAATLIVYPYNDLQTEYEAGDIARLQWLLGNFPTCSIGVELRRSAGNRAADDATTLVRGLLGKLDGIVDATYSEMWTCREIETGAAKQDGPFLSCYRCHEEPG